MVLSLQELAQRFGAVCPVETTGELCDVASLEVAQSRHVAFAETKKQIPALLKSQAGAVFIRQDVADLVQEPCPPLLVVASPQKSFIEAMLLFRPQPERRPAGIAPSAHVDPTAQLGSDCIVHPGAVIGRDVKIGERCEIGPGAVIGDGCVLGDDCLLYAYVVLYPGMQLKNRIIIHATAVIGADGFGYHFENGRFLKIPHTGTVVIEDDVEIGAGATIDRGMIEATIIGTGTKLDNQVMIAHNCRIGRGNVFASQVGLAGSVTTGEYVQMGGKVGIADHCHIATGVKLGGSAGVMSDLLVPGTYHDIPAIPEKDALKNHVNIRRVPEMRKEIKDLGRQLAELQAQLQQLAAGKTPESAECA